MIVFSVLYAITAILDSNDEKRMLRTERAIGCMLAASILYWIEGSAVVSSLYSSLMSEEILTLEVSTNAFMGFIIGIVIAIVYYIVKRSILYKICKTGEQVLDETVSTLSVLPAPEKDIGKSWEHISKYKELLDAGAITPEEYYKIKADLLGK